MTRPTNWLLATASLSIAIAAASGLGRRASTAPATQVAATALVTREDSAQRVSCFDTSPHRTTYVTVEPGVRLEVLDWGGTGETMVLLTGLGDNAHAFDQFAYQFTDRFHVISITRRGYGRSSQPAHGYDLATRTRDDIAVLDSMKVRRAVFVGHSVAGTELSRLAAVYPHRVDKLVYLDALDIGSGGWAKLPQPPGSPEYTAADLASVQRVAAASARDDGYRTTLAAICHMIRTDSAGRVLGPTTPPAIAGKILAGLEPADYDQIRAPALGILNAISPRFRTPYYRSLSPATQQEFDRSVGALSTWVRGAIQRFRAEVQGARVVELQNTNHYVYVVDEALVVREMRDFLLGR